MAFLRSSLATPDYGKNGAVSVSLTDSGSNVATDIISLSDAKEWLRVDYDTDDSLITRLIDRVVRHTEATYNFHLIEKTVVAEWEYFARTVNLPETPATSITSIKTVDNNGTETTLTNNQDYYLTGDTLVFDKIYDYESPYTRVRLKATYTAGYTTIPSDIKLGLENAIASKYEDRQDIAGMNVSEMVNGSKSFFRNYVKMF